MLRTSEIAHSVTPAGGGQMIELLRRRLQNYSLTNEVQEEQAIKEMLLEMGKELKADPGGEVIDNRLLQLLFGSENLSFRNAVLLTVELYSSMKNGCRSFNNITGSHPVTFQLTMKP